MDWYSVPIFLVVVACLVYCALLWRHGRRSRQILERDGIHEWLRWDRRNRRVWTDPFRRD